MRAVGFLRPLPVDDPDCLQDFDLPRPEPGDHDLLVRVRAISVNPVDTKVRRRFAPANDPPRVLGWDAVGEVVAVGPQVSRFRAGSRVFYAGELNRPGSNAEFQCVDERLVAPAPERLADAEAAALPLTAITAWELLFEHLGLTARVPDEARATGACVLVVGAAGGVGSMLVQLLRTLTGADVIGTASRDASRDWLRNLGVQQVVDHSQPLRAQLEALDVGPVTHIASLNGTSACFEQYIDLLPPFGRIAMIDDPAAPLDVMKMKQKSLSLHIEYMFARSMFRAPDMEAQGTLLHRVADLVDRGLLRATAQRHLGTIHAGNLRQAHALLEAGHSVGKIVLEGFGGD